MTAQSIISMQHEDRVNIFAGKSAARSELLESRHAAVPMARQSITDFTARANSQFAPKFLLPLMNEACRDQRFRHRLKKLKLKQ